MTTHEMKVDDYLTLPYRILLTPNRSDDGHDGWVAEIDELPGCISQGSSPEEAVERIRDAMAGWISVALEDGKPVPLPRGEHRYSGRFLVRLPRSLHGELARAAEDEGVSLNQLVQSALATFVGTRFERAALPRRSGSHSIHLLSELVREFPGDVESESWSTFEFRDFLDKSVHEALSSSSEEIADRVSERLEGRTGAASGSRSRGKTRPRSTD